MEIRVVLENPASPPQQDPCLEREILRAIRWYDALSSGVFPTIEDMAQAEGCSPSLISSSLPLAFLAPDIVEAILEGRQPTSLTLARIKRACPLAMSWEEQRAVLLR